VTLALPFYSAFNRGSGESLHQGGVRVSDRPWFCLALQHVQPCFAANMQVADSARTTDPRPQFLHYDHVRAGLRGK